MDDQLAKILSQLLEEAKNLVISIQDKEFEEALINYAKFNSIQGKLGSMLVNIFEVETEG